LDSQFKSYEVLKISAKVWACSQPLPMHQILPKAVKIYPKNQNFEIPPKNQDFSVFQNFMRIEKALEHVGFLIQNFFNAFFVIKNWSLYVNFSRLACGN